MIFIRAAEVLEEADSEVLVADLSAVAVPGEAGDVSQQSTVDSGKRGKKIIYKVELKIKITHSHSE